MLDWADDAYWATVKAKVNSDGEFARHARFWTATIRLGIGHRNVKLGIDNGAVDVIERWPGGMGVDLAIQAPDADWDALLSAQPPPFYQDLYPASLHHGFDVVGSLTDYCAYYPAIRRLIDVMREVHAGAEESEFPSAVRKVHFSGLFDGVYSIQYEWDTKIGRVPVGELASRKVKPAKGQSYEVWEVLSRDEEIDGVRAGRWTDACWKVRDKKGAEQVGVANDGAAVSRSDPTIFDAATGRYVHLTIGGTTHRVYFEEAGSGDVGLLLQHTAGADGRQWRHLFRLVAYDLPYHGKSIPPADVRWWQREYRLTRDFLMAVPLALAAALGLERPVYMGSSIGGHLAVDLALYHPQAFRAVVGLEASAYTPGGFVDEFDHPRIGNDFKGHLMYGMMAPTSPEALRRETAWVYSQGAPAVFKGDLYYYSVDHDVRNTAATINTDVCAVDILNGEYDWSGTPSAGEELAAMIPGAGYRTMAGLGHFPMSEHPARFLTEIRPVLDRILAAD